MIQKKYGKSQSARQLFPFVVLLSRTEDFILFFFKISILGPLAVTTRTWKPSFFFWFDSSSYYLVTLCMYKCSFSIVL